MSTTEAITAYMDRLTTVTVEEAEALGKHWSFDTPESPRGVARKFASRMIDADENADAHLWYTARDLTAGKGKWTAGWAAGDAALALQVRGRLPQEMYNTLTNPAVQVFGSVHPEDAQ